MPHAPAPARTFACALARKFVRTSARALALAAALGLAACASRPVDNCGLDDATRLRATALVDAMVQRGHAPGAVVDLRCNGRPWLQAAAGMADSTRQRPMRQDDLFRIYSMTKPVTALAVLLLAQDGRLELDDPLSRHLPEFASASVYLGEQDGSVQTQALRRPLSVRDLLRHTAGMPYLAPVPHPVFKRYVARGIDNGSGEKHRPGDGSAPVDSAAELSRRIAAIPLLHQPGERFLYGSASDVAGRLVEAVSGQPLGDFLRARVFAPLKMNDTAFQVGPASAARLTAAYGAPSQRPSDGSILHGQRSDGLGASTFTQMDPADASVFSRPRPLHFGGAGLVSTAADYQRLLAMFLAGGAGLLRPEAVAEMSRNQLSAAAVENSTLGRQGLGYGLGLGIVLDPVKAPAPVPAGTTFWGGAASTYFWVDPQRRITGVLMTQVFGGDVAPYFVELLSTLYGPPPSAAAR